MAAPVVFYSYIFIVKSTKRILFGTQLPKYYYVANYMYYRCDSPGNRVGAEETLQCTMVLEDCVYPQNSETTGT